jgi:osmotically inducible protein OsmC
MEVGMATVRTAAAHWEGSLMEGAGTVELSSSKLATFDVTWASRTESPEGRTSPEELIAAAHATCFSMSLSHALAQAGTPPTMIDTTADVTFQAGQGITGIALRTRGSVPGITAEQFAEAADGAKVNCPVSQALTGTTITLSAEFVEA